MPLACGQAWRAHVRLMLTQAPHPQAVLEDALAAAAAGDPTSGYAWVRQGHAACLLGRNVYLWSGMVVREGRKTGQLLVLNLDSCSWRVSENERRKPLYWQGKGAVAAWMPAESCNLLL